MIELDRTASDFIGDNKKAKNSVPIGYLKMDAVPYVNEIGEYLKADDVIDYRNTSIMQLADELFQNSKDELAYIKAAYAFVSNHIAHSADKNEDVLTCTASEVLEAGHGICFAKSHLLAALLRCKGIPAGFCYQKLILDDETAPVLVYQGIEKMDQA